MADFINTIDVYGDEVVASAIIDRSINTSFDDDVLTSIGSYAFQSCYSLTSVSIPNATKIGGYAFQYCNSLTSVSAPRATSFGFSAFANCSAMTSVTIPSATRFGQNAFFSCKGLTSVSLPNVTKFDNSAFANCSAMTSVTLPAVPPTLSNVNAFSGINADCVFYIPTGSRSAYENATNWSTLTGQYTFTEV